MGRKKSRVAKKVVKPSKKEKVSRTIVTVEQLDQLQNRRDELAQLTGGHAADDALSFADSLLTQAEEQKTKVVQAK